MEEAMLHPTVAQKKIKNIYKMNKQPNKKTKGESCVQYLFCQDYRKFRETKFTQETAER